MGSYERSAEHIKVEDDDSTSENNPKNESPGIPQIREIEETEIKDQIPNRNSKISGGFNQNSRLDNCFSFQCNIGKENTKQPAPNEPVIPILRANPTDEPQEGPMASNNGGGSTFAGKESEGYGSWTPVGFKSQQNVPENRQTFAGAFNMKKCDSKQYSSDTQLIEEVPR